MKRWLSLIVLPIILMTMFLIPAATYGRYNGCPDITVTTLPPSDKTLTSAVLDGVMCFDFGGKRDGKECEGVMVFEYGNAPGIYTGEVPADVVSATMKDDVLCHNVKGLLERLKPCMTYYVRLKYMVIENTKAPGNYTNGIGVGLDTAQLLKSAFTPELAAGCPGIYYGNEVKFRTGCDVEEESHGSGGMGAGTPTLRPYIPSNIVVQSATMAATKVSPGENVDIAATVTNRGGSNGTSKITLNINGQEAESKGITLASGESTQVHFSVSRNDPGTYSIYVNGVPAGTLTVDLFANNDILIYAVIALFTIGIIGVLYLVFKRRAA